MRLVPFALMPSSPRSPLLAAYNLWAQADFAGCLAELQALDLTLISSDRVEAALLRARSYLRIDRAAAAVKALELDVALLDDEDLRCSVEAMRGFALVSAGRTLAGLALLRDALERAEEYDVDSSVRMEALYHTAFAHWIAGDYDAADECAVRALDPRVDGVAPRATALRGWIRVGRLRYAEALPFFRDARRAFMSSIARDAAFEASVVHALATYDLQLLQHDDEPRYYIDELPRVPGSSLDSYRLLTGAVDAWRAALAGDEERALTLAAHTEAVDVDPHWRVLGLATRAGIAQAFGHERFALLTADVGFATAMGLNWGTSPGESRLGLLYGAERLVPHDLGRARALLAAYTRITTEVEPRYTRGAHANHRATEAHARGVVAFAASDPAVCTHLRTAHETFASFGFHWRALASQLALGRHDSAEGRRAYRHARAEVLDRFPRSHLMRELHDFTPPIVIPAGDPLTPAQAEIVRALCAGKTPRDVAAARGTSPETVRNQLKQIYQRIDVHSVEALRRRYAHPSA
jgi:DNA-binding CsgD family transcriptional regulator